MHIYKQFPLVISFYFPMTCMCDLKGSSLKQVCCKNFMLKMALVSNLN